MPIKKYPSLGLAMIVKDGVADDLRRCLHTIAPYVDQIVLVDTGLERNSASVVGPEFKAEVYSFDWRDDFAAARDFSLSFIKTDWFLWIDHDDELEGADLIKPLLASLSPEVGGVWCPYDYSHDEYGNVDTTHIRERILRTDIGWHWAGRIHEVLVPHRSLSWERNEDIRWVHKRGRVNQTERNLPIILEWMQDEPDNIRLWLFLANQYNVDSQPLRAAQWYTKFWTDSRGQPIDRMQAMTFAAHNWRQLENLREAIRANMAEITEFPEVADGYLGMCENMILLKEWDKAIVWGEGVLRHNPADPMNFVNPLDYTCRIWQDLAIAYAGAGDLEKAIHACGMALEPRPDDKDVLRNREIFAARLEKECQLDAYVTIHSNGTALKALKLIPKELRGEKKARDVWVPALLRKAYRGTQPRIVFFCGPSLEEWNGETLETSGMGGSETAVVEVASRLVRDGWQAVVYNSSGGGEGTHAGVTYADWERFRGGWPHDVFVSWRHPEAINERPNSQQKYLWCHDVHYGGRLTEELAAQYTKVLGVSEWHASYMKQLYPFLDNLDFVPNGIDLSRFEPVPFERNHARFVYASSPDRGLASLLRLWPHIRKVEPMAELHIFYGWETFLKAAEQGLYDLYRLHDMLVDLGKQPGVVWRGRVPQAELAREFLQAEIWAYPTSFLETSCITAMEALAAGLRVVTTRCGNIPNIVGDAGVCIPGNSGSIAYGRRFLPIVYAMMLDVETRDKYEKLGPERAALFTWDKAMEKWAILLKEKVAV